MMKEGMKERREGGRKGGREGGREERVENTQNEAFCLIVFFVKQSL